MDAVIEDMWTPYKHLYNTFQTAVSNRSGFTSDLEQCLKKYKHNFSNLLRNPPRSEKSRNLLRNALNEGVPMQGHSRKTKMSQDLADEAVILSDMFDLDECFAVELLCTAQRQQKHHPGLSRGLVAVLLYYDGRKAISCTLRDMFQVVSGVSWNTELPKEITGLVTNYAESLVDGSGILGRLLQLLEEMDVDKECAMLTTNRAFGSKKHQNQVLGLYEDIQQALAMALFNWSAQRGLPRHIAIRLMHQLANRKNHDAGGNMDDVTLIMLMALLYAYDTSMLLVTGEPNEHTTRLPIFSDREFAECFLEELYAQSSWQAPRLNAIIAYSFGLTLASLRHAPLQLQATAISIINRDEMLIDEALGAQVFVFFHSLLLEKDLVYSTQFFYRRVHLLITDFIDFMNSKVSELRGRADESSHTIISFLNEGLEPPPNLDSNFELLMLCVAKMHGDPRVTIRLCNEYWGPGDPNGSTAFKNTSRSVSLFKFISLASDLLPQTLFKAYLKMISGLTRTDFSARCAFNMLRVPQMATGGKYAVSWDHFFTTLGNYYTSMRNDFNTNIGMSGETIYRTRSTPKAITQREAEHLVAVMGIIQAVAEHDEVSRIMICDHPNWQTPQVLLGLVACATPLFLKAEILHTLAALAKSKETARVIWFHLEASQIIPTVPVSRSYAQCSLLEEMEQIESRSEQYNLTRGILQLLYTLMTTNLPKSLGAGQRTPAYEGYLKSMINSVLLKFYNRAYKVPSEKWQVGAQCLKLLYYLLATYRPSAMDFLETVDEPPYPGFHVMMQLQLKSEMLQLLLCIVEEVRERLDNYNRFQGKKLLEECSLYALLILEAALAKQNAFFEAHSAANCPILLSGLNRMLLDLNPRSRKPDHVLNIIKYVTYNSWLPRHALAAIKILASVTQLPNVSTQILSMYGQGSNEKLEIRQGFVECLEMEVCVGKHDDDLLDQLALNNHVPYLGFGDDLDNEREMSGEREYSTIESQLELQAGDGALESKPASIELQLKEAIIKLFEMNLSQQLPNFVYFLLGVDVLREFMANGRQHLAIEMQSSCVNSVVLLLEKYMDKQRHSDKYCEHTARIVERIYHLFHGLCANRRTAETILRYFRLTCSDFLLRHLRSLPFRQHREDHVLHAMGHLLNCVSIDVKLAAKHGQMTRFNQMCDILLIGNGMERSSHGLSMELGHSLISQPSSSFLAMDVLPAGGSISAVAHGAGSASLGAPNTGVKSLKPSLLQETSQGLHVTRLLDILVLEAGTLSQPQLEFFDGHLITQLLRDCEASAEAGANSRANLINVRKLYYILTDELYMVQSIIASGQRKAISTEIMLLLNHAVNINRVRTQRCATLAFMAAWGQLVQVLFSNMPDAVLPATQRPSTSSISSRRYSSRCSPYSPSSRYPYR
nr:RE24713p [Drosophila melanogaster]